VRLELFSTICLIVDMSKILIAAIRYITRQGNVTQLVSGDFGLEARFGESYSRALAKESPDLRIEVAGVADSLDNFLASNVKSAGLMPMLRLFIVESRSFIHSKSQVTQLWAAHIAWRYPCACHGESGNLRSQKYILHNLITCSLLIVIDLDLGSSNFNIRHVESL
jgi:hypothetical protein